MRKSLDVLAEGLVSKNSRGDRTSIELFQVSLRDWPTSLLQFVKGLEEQ